MLLLPAIVQFDLHGAPSLAKGAEEEKHDLPPVLVAHKLKFIIVMPLNQLIRLSRFIATGMELLAINFAAFLARFAKDAPCTGIPSVPIPKPTVD